MKQEKMAEITKYASGISKVSLGSRSEGAKGKGKIFLFKKEKSVNSMLVFPEQV